MEVEVEVEVVLVKPFAELPVSEGLVAGLFVAEHPDTATITALMIAAAMVAPGRDRVVMDGCPPLNPRTFIIRYTAAGTPAAVHLCLPIAKIISLLGG